MATVDGVPVGRRFLGGAMATADVVPAFRVTMLGPLDLTLTNCAAYSNVRRINGLACMVQLAIMITDSKE